MKLMSSSFAIAFAAAPAGAQQPEAADTAPASAPVQQVATAKPQWTELSSDQQAALLPLSGEWDQLDSVRKNKWLIIIDKYPSMKPDEQQRLQERMQDWVKLTPEQRRRARENFVHAKKLGADRKSAQWEQYQQLPEEQKKELAARATAKKHVATLPRATPRSTSKTMPPIQALPKPVLEQSVAPQTAGQSLVPPPIQSDTK